MSATILRGPGMVARALAVIGEERLIAVGEHDKQRTFLQKLRERCNWLVEKPEKFPELYGDVRKRWPDRRVRQKDALILECFVRHHDLVDKRIGTPRSDGSVWGVSLKKIAIETGIGDPSQRVGERDFKGRRNISRRIRAFHEAGYVGGHKSRQVNIFTRKSKAHPEGKAYRWAAAGNPRYQVPASYRTKAGDVRHNRLPGRYINHPSVRVLAARFIERLELDEQATREKTDAEKYRQQIGPGRFIDIRRRRQRDRDIKARQRAKGQLQRIYYREEAAELLAAKQSRRLE